MQRTKYFSLCIFQYYFSQVAEKETKMMPQSFRELRAEGHIEITDSKCILTYETNEFGMVDEGTSDVYRRRDQKIFEVDGSQDPKRG